MASRLVGIATLKKKEKRRVEGSTTYLYLLQHGEDPRQSLGFDVSTVRYTIQIQAAAWSSGLQRLVEQTLSLS
jgi:hypothetical protein